MGNVIFPVVGTFLGFVVAFFIAAYIEKKADQVSDSFVQTTFDSTPFEFKCPYCGDVWKRTYEKGVDFTTDFVLKWQKNSLVEEIRSEASSSRVTAIIAGVICAPCAFYCITHLSGQSEYLLWWLLFIIGLPALCIAINSGVKSHNKSQEADDLESMSISSFRHSSYRAGNPFVGTVRDIDENGETEPIAKQINSANPKQLESSKDNLEKLDELLETGTITNEEYINEKKKIGNSAQPVNNADKKKIELLQNLKMLLDSGILTPEEYNSQKKTTLSVVSIPWDEGKSKLETLASMKSLLDEGILTQQEFDFHKKAIIKNRNSEESFILSKQQSSYEEIGNMLQELNKIIATGLLTEEESTELKKEIVSSAISASKEENNKISILRNIKLLLDFGILTPEEYKSQKRSTLSIVSIPWDQNKSNLEILVDMKSILDEGILTQEEFDFHKKSLLNNN